MESQAEFEAELAQAEAARLIGNEGKARVCARRAAGIVARLYFEQREIPVRSGSGYDQLRNLSELEDVSIDIRRVIGHFLLKVDETYHLPADIDLIAEARWLARQLVGDND